MTPSDLPPLGAISAALTLALDRIIVREGTTFEDDPDDPGGATKCGISLAYALAARLDVDGDGDTDIDDIRAVDTDLAKRIIYHRFALAPGVLLLPAAVQPVVLDMAFNQGIGGSRAVLDAVAEWAEGAHTSVPRDQKSPLAPHSKILTAAAVQYGDVAVIDAIVRARISRYEMLAARNSKLKKYINGWTLRALAFGSKDLRGRYAALLKKYKEAP